MTKILRNTFSLSIAEIINIVSHIAILAIVYSQMGIHIFGIYSAIVVFRSIFLPLINLGTLEYSIKEFSKQQSLQRKWFPNLIFLKLVTAIALQTIIIFFASIITNESIIITGVIVVSFSFFFHGFNTVLFSIFRSRQVMKYEIYMSLIKSIVELFLVFIVVFSGLSIIWLLVANVVSVLFSSLSGIYSIKNWQLFSRKIDFSLCKAIFIKSIPYSMNNFLKSVVFRISSIVLIYFNLFTYLAYYETSLKIVLGVGLLAHHLLMALLPPLSKYYRTNMIKFRQIFKKYVVYSAFAGLLAMLIFSVVGIGILFFIFNEMNITLLTVFYLMLSSIIFLFINQVVESLFIAANMIKALVKINAFTFVVSLILTIVLIKLLSIIGAAVACLLTVVVNSCILYLVYWIKFKNIRNSFNQNE